MAMDFNMGMGTGLGGSNSLSSLWGGKSPFGDIFGGGSGMDTQNLMSMLSGNMSQFQNFIQNPTANPLYKKQLSGLLAALQPGEEQAQSNLMDMFRSAGNMSSGQYGAAASNLQGELQRNRQVTASQLLGQMFPQMSQAMMGPMGIYSSLIQALMQKQPPGGMQVPQGKVGPM